MGKDVSVNLDNIKFDVNSDTNVDANIDSTSNINVDTSKIRTEIVLPQPLQTESRFAITDPIVSQNTSSVGLDIRPMVMDFCFKFEFGKLPPACIRQPYQHHFGVTLFGMEILGLNFAGESRTVIEEVSKHPQIAWGGEGTGKGMMEHRSSPQVEDGGLRIRLGS